MRSHKVVVAFVVLFAAALVYGQSSATYQQPFFRALRNDNGAGFMCASTQCGVQAGYGQFSQGVTAAGDVNAGSLSTPGPVTAASLNTGALAATDIVSSSVSTGPLNAGSSTLGTTSTANLTSDGGISAGSLSSQDLTATRNVSLPGLTGSPDAGYTFAAPPQGLTTTVCTNVPSAVALPTLNTAALVTTITSRVVTPNTPCFVVPPSNLSVNVDYFCRPGTSSAAVYAKTGLVGLSASSGNWCVVVVGG